MTTIDIEPQQNNETTIKQEEPSSKLEPISTSSTEINSTSPALKSESIENNSTPIDFKRPRDESTTETLQQPPEKKQKTMKKTNSTMLAALEKLKKVVAATEYINKVEPTVVSTVEQQPQQVINIASPQLSALSTPVPTPGKRGRKPGPKKMKKNKDSDNDDDDEDFSLQQKPKATPIVPKRAPRPKKTPLPQIDLEAAAQSLSPIFKECLALLKRLKEEEIAGPFLDPVDADALGIPDYYTVIKHPMDLNTIHTKLCLKKYRTVYDFANDVKLVWKNCFTYNQEGSDVHNYAKTLSNMFDQEFQKIEASVASDIYDLPLAPSSELDLADSKDYSRRKATPKMKKTALIEVREMSYEEKKELSENIGKLDHAASNKVVEMIVAKTPKQQTADDEIEIDLDLLDTVTLRELEKFVNQQLRKQKKAEEIRAKKEAKQKETSQAPSKHKKKKKESSEVPESVSEGTSELTGSNVNTFEEEYESMDSSDSSDSDDSENDQVAKVNEISTIQMDPVPIVQTAILSENKWLMEESDDEDKKGEEESDNPLWKEYRQQKQVEKQRQLEMQEKQKQEQERRQKEAELERQRLQEEKEKQEAENTRAMEEARERAKREREQLLMQSKTEGEDEDMDDFEQFSMQLRH